MGLLSIIGRLDLNGAGFTKTLNAAEKRADKFANGVTRKLAGVAGGAFGINALKNIAKEAIENAHAVTQLAKKFNLTTDEVQLLKAEADKTGDSFENLVKDAGKLEETLSRLRGGEVIFSKKQIESLDQAHEVIQEFKNAAARTMAKGMGNPVGLLKLLMAPLAGRDGLKFANSFLNEEPQTGGQEKFQEDEARNKRALQARLDAEEKSKEKIDQMDKQAAELREKAVESVMTNEERIKQLAEKRNELLDQLGPHNRETISAKGLALAKLDAEIAGLGRGGAETARSRQMSPLSDSLSSVGNMLGMNPNSPQVRELNKANRLLEEIRNNTRSSLGGTSFPN